MHFDNEVQISGVDKKVQISDLSPLYVGIHKKRTSQNDLEFFVRSGDLDFFVYCEKVGPFCTSISYLNCRATIFSLIPRPCPHATTPNYIIPISANATKGNQEVGAS